MPIDLEWVKNLPQRPELTEKVEAFVSRFGRLQDHLGEKLLPRFAALVGESRRTWLDTLAFAERAGVLANADAFIAARKLRHALVPEYMHEARDFLEGLLAAEQACKLLFQVIAQVEAEFKRLGVPQEQ